MKHRTSDANANQFECEHTLALKFATNVTQTFQCLLGAAHIFNQMGPRNTWPISLCQSERAERERKKESGSLLMRYAIASRRELRIRLVCVCVCLKHFNCIFGPQVEAEAEAGAKAKAQLPSSG